MKVFVPATIALLCITFTSHAQDTFSIVAVDPVTGEVGSAGASCVPFDVAIISDLHPGIGAINTQAYYLAGNQNYARRLMDAGVAPAAIIDSLVAHDVQDYSAVRQYGIAALASGGTTAGHTGDFTDDYKAHRLGQTYAVQGNILLGPGIIDSIATRFERAGGRLADRLMYALMGARVVGADTRCAQYGTSSLGAFIRVARPGDRVDSIELDLSVSIPSGISEPLDSLEREFAAWRVASIGADDNTITQIHVETTGGDVTAVRLELAQRADVRIELFDAGGRMMLVEHPGTLEHGQHRIPLIGLSALASGTYYARVTCGLAVRTLAVTRVH